MSAAQMIFNGIMWIYFVVAACGFIVALLSPWYASQSFEDEKELE